MKTSFGLVGSCLLVAVLAVFVFGTYDADAACNAAPSGKKCGPGTTSNVYVNGVLVYTYTKCNTVSGSGKKYCATKSVTNTYGTYTTRVGCYRTESNCCDNTTT